MSGAPYKCASCGLVNAATEPVCRRCQAAPGAAPPPPEAPGAPRTGSWLKRSVAGLAALAGAAYLGLQASWAASGTPFTYSPKLNFVIGALVGGCIAGVFDPDILRGDASLPARSWILLGVAAAISCGAVLVLHASLG